MDATLQTDAIEPSLFELTSEELDRYPTGVITLDRDGKILRYNRAEASLSRLKPHEVIGRNFFADVAPCTAVRGFQGRFEDFARERTTSVERFDWVFMFKWGQQNVTITLLRRENRPEIHLVVTVRSQAAPVPSDIVATLVGARRIVDVEDAPRCDVVVGMWEDDPETNTLFRSETMHHILAAGAELDAYANPIVRYAHPDHVDALTSEIAHAERHGHSYLIRTRIVAGDGVEKDVLVHGTSFAPAVPGERHRSIGSIVDLSQHRDLQDDLWRAAHLDPLTQLPNRRYLMDRLGASLATSDVAIAVCFLDLDRFKLVNDTSGHAAGDALLRTVGTRLCEIVRENDIVSRINGDEFVVVLFDRPHESDVTSVVRRMLAGVHAPITIDGRVHQVAASIGVATFPQDGRTATDLLASADTAMYRAKKTRNGDFLRFSFEMRDIAEKDRDLAIELSSALRNGEIVPYFQSIVDARTHAIVGAEALARWEHPTRGTIHPADFITLAENNGLVDELGRQILRAACFAAKSWYDACGARAPFISVNVSPLQFHGRDFIATVQRVLAETGLPPKRLELELTESLIVDRFEETMLALADLKVLGVTLSIDDFGTGYSALAYLKYFPIDTIKLDRAFVEGIGANELDDAIVGTIVSLARTLHLKIIAEGVETAAQATRLGEIGCDYLQGFLFDHAAPGAAFVERRLFGDDRTRSVSR